MKTLYVGNIPYSSSAEEIRKLFEIYGKVHSVKLIINRKTGAPRGFGFIKMDAADADAALTDQRWKAVGGKKLKIDEARELLPTA